MFTIYTVNALAGAGKSTAAGDYAFVQASKGGQVLYVAPTLSLIEELSAKLRSRNPSVSIKEIHSGVADGVVSAILASLRSKPQGGRVLLVTWLAFVALPFFPRRNDWTVIVDE